MILRRVQLLGPVFSIVKEAQIFAHLFLKVPKCCIVPVGGQLTPALVERFRTWLARNIPEWADFEIADKVKYLGIWLGPGVECESWGSPFRKYLSR
eukprot:933936-Pyramimonas_sp.AAC.1